MKTPQPQVPELARPEFNRVSVPFEKARSNRSQWIIAAIVLLIVVAGSGVLAARWWRGGDLSGSNVPANANVATTPSPTPTATPSPSPSASPTAKPKKSPPKKQGPFKKVLNKIKGIFK